MFALFGEPTSGGKELVERVRFNARLELLMKPVKDMATMAMLHLPACLSNGDMRGPLGPSGNKMIGGGSASGSSPFSWLKGPGQDIGDDVPVGGDYKFPNRDQSYNLDEGYYPGSDDLFEGYSSPMGGDYKFPELPQDEGYSSDPER